MTPTFEQAIEIVKALPKNEREKLRDWIDKNQEKSSDFENRQERFQRSMRWIHEHREKFDGQWVALDGDNLLAHGTDGKKVHSEAQAKGVQTPLMHRVSVKETQPFGGW